MDPVISGLLDDLPDKPPRSKLEAHADVIAALRRKRRTYCEIAQFFREHLSIAVSPSTIHDFVRVRRGREKRKADAVHDEVPAPAKRVSRLNPIENPSQTDEDALQRIAALKRYISLLELEEKRLNWLRFSQSSSERERTDAGSNWRLNTEKITRAEMELKTLEVRRLS